MKLGELRAAIRKSKLAPSVEVSIAGSPLMRLLLQKGSVLGELDTAFPGGKPTETGLNFDEATGLISGPPILEHIERTQLISATPVADGLAEVDDDVVLTDTESEILDI